MIFLKNKIHIHPLTIPIFVLVYFTPFRNRFFILYIFIFFHELSHALASILLGEKVWSIRLLPWGCMLSLSTIPGKKHSFFIFLAGPLFNLFMYFLGIFPTENLSLALFNLIPVMPLDGGVLTDILFPQSSFYISFCFIIFLTLACIYYKVIPLMPIVLAFVLFMGEKNNPDKTIRLKIIRHFNEKN